MKYYIGLGVILTLLATTWLYGQSQFKAGQANIVAEIEKARTASVAEKEKIDDEIKSLDTDELLKRALSFVQSGGR